MLDLSLPAASLGTAYPEQVRARPGKLDKVATWLSGPVVRQARVWRAQRTQLLEAVERHAESFAGLPDPGLRQAADELRVLLRREGFTGDAVARTFALVREAATRTIGQRHYDVQLLGGWVLLNGLVAEMETGEGKTITATLPACTAALAGVPVHIITVNDYLTARDAATMGPIYQALGLSVGAIVHGKDPAARRAAYACDVTYCTNKELTFDYLRDRIALGRDESRIQLAIERLAGGKSKAGQLNLRGLFYAIVDEADSVLIDEARTPLVISGAGDSAPEREMYETALELAGRLEAGADFRMDPKERHLELTDRGRGRLDEWAPALPPLFHGERRREELVSQALVATNLFHRDTHYLVRDQKVHIIDEFTGRILADRTWEQGLHQMVEAKEQLPLSNRQTSVARITYQRFFRRYLWLAGMTGTAHEVRRELWLVYGLPVVRVPTHRPVLRRSTGDRVFTTEAEKWAAIVARVKALHQIGRPVLIGTRSVAASEKLSAHLNDAGLEHQLLNARQDEQEAQIVAEAGQYGRIMVATNMAGRGTDIKLGPGVAELGGLHVIATELHESARIDRQLFGRGGRQGDPGTLEAMISLEDELIRVYLAGVGELPKRLQSPRWRRLLFSLAQKRAEAVNAGIRRQLLTFDDQLGDMLAFTGRRD
ncbi:MAG TPA: preprotein translocase subunit SecA [Burkholderiales bacterium]|nr:preprotein translocase subunit SecA [Burkholderiales bacterium]